MFVLNLIKDKISPSNLDCIPSLSEIPYNTLNMLYEESQIALNFEIKKEENIMQNSKQIFSFLTIFQTLFLIYLELIPKIKTDLSQKNISTYTNILGVLLLVFFLFSFFLIKRSKRLGETDVIQLIKSIYADNVELNHKKDYIVWKTTKYSLQQEYLHKVNIKKAILFNITLFILFLILSINVILIFTILGGTFN